MKGNYLQVIGNSAPSIFKGNPLLVFGAKRSSMSPTLSKWLSFILKPVKLYRPNPNFLISDTLYI